VRETPLKQLRQISALICSLGVVIALGNI